MIKRLLQRKGYMYIKVYMTVLKEDQNRGNVKLLRELLDKEPDLHRVEKGVRYDLVVFKTKNDYLSTLLTMKYGSIIKEIKVK